MQNALGDPEIKKLAAAVVATAVRATRRAAYLSMHMRDRFP